MGIPSDPEVSLGSFGPITSLMIATGNLLDLFWGVIISLSNSDMLLVMSTPFRSGNVSNLLAMVISQTAF